MKKIKKFGQFVNERFIDYDVDYAQPEVEMISGISERYEKRYLDMLLMEDVVKEDTYENKNDITLQYQKNKVKIPLTNKQQHSLKREP